jgi:hypothetical protein
MANELAALKLVGDIKATYAAAVRSGRDLVDYALQIGRLLNQARPDIPHGEWEDYVENICGIPFGTAKRWQLVAKSVDAGLEVKSFTLNDLKSATSIEDVKKLVATSKPAPPPKPPKKEPSDGAAGSQVSSPVAPTGEQDAPDHEEPAASDTDDTDVSTDDAGSVVCDDTQLDEAFEPVSWFERFKQLWDAADDLGRTAIRAFILGESKKKSKGFFSEVPIPASLAGADFVEAWKLWEDHRSSIKGLKAATKTAVEQQLKRLAKWGVSRSVAAIQHSVANSYQGIFEEKDNASPATVKKGRAAMEFTE